MAHPRIAGDDAGDVDGEEATTLADAGDGVGGQGHRQHDDWIERHLQRRPVDDQHDEPAANGTDQCADADLKEELADEADVGCAGQGRSGDNLDEGERQEDRDRIVRAGFDLQCRAHAVAQRDAADAQEEEDGSGIGRRQDRAEEQALQEGQPEQELRHQAEDKRGDEDADDGQGYGGKGGDTQRRQAGLEAGIEQDDGERDRADEVGRLAIVEGDAEPVLACDQTDQEEDEQQRGAEAKADQAREDRGDNERRTDENGNVHRLQHR